MKIKDFLGYLRDGRYDETFGKLYGSDGVSHQKERYEAAAKKFAETYSEDSEIEIFSASGRTEVGGNHTDHQHGCVLAAAVDVDIIGVVAHNDSGIIRVLSEGYDEVRVECDQLEIHNGEHGSAAIIRGVAAKFAELGVKVQGFDMYATSDVPGGSGLSSSAAFEVLVGTVIDKHYNGGKAGAVEIAKIGQYAENVYFGKQCGLMDEMVSSVGGFVFIDFEDTENPVIESCSVDFDALGYDLFITDTKGSHADLTDDYVAVKSEMNQVAGFFGKEYLRQVNKDEFWNKLVLVREKCSDRAIVRAMHFFDENLRPKMEFEALKKGDIDEFLRVVRASGESSERLLQNIYSTKKPLNQEITIGLEVSRRIIGEKGAVRVHGGGFAGTIQAFVPKTLSGEYMEAMNGLFGADSCRLTRIRPVGAVEIK